MVAIEISSWKQKLICGRSISSDANYTLDQRQDLFAQPLVMPSVAFDSLPIDAVHRSFVNHDLNYFQIKRQMHSAPVIHYRATKNVTGLLKSNLVLFCNGLQAVQKLIRTHPTNVGDIVSGLYDSWLIWRAQLPLWCQHTEQFVHASFYATKHRLFGRFSARSVNVEMKSTHLSVH